VCIQAVDFSFDQQQPKRMDIGMHDLAILPIIAGDCFKVPPDIFAVANTLLPCATSMSLSISAEQSLTTLITF
jgi:hypothetical protein